MIYIGNIKQNIKIIFLIIFLILFLDNNLSYTIKKLFSNSIYDL